MEEKGMFERISQRLQILGLSERQASIQAVGNPDLVRNLKRERSRSPRGESLAKLAKVLGVTESWLLGSTEDSGAALSETEFGVRFGGVVEAGAFRPENALNQDEEFRIIPLAPDARYPMDKLAAYEVVGDSMNLANIHPGMWVQAVAIGAYERQHGEPGDGKLVIVVRRRNDDPERELTIKRLRIFRDRIELHPDSSNAVHRPVVLMHGDQDERLQIEIVAVVLSATWLFG